MRKQKQFLRQVRIRARMVAVVAVIVGIVSGAALPVAAFDAAAEAPAAANAVAVALKAPASTTVQADVAAPSAAITAASVPTETCTLAVGVRTCDLWAATGTITMPDSVALTVWGYTDTMGAPASVPGPALVANAGETVVVNLHNDLAEATSLLIDQQDGIPDLVGVAPGATKSYTFTASTPGTFIYEAGLLPNAQHQVAMGMYGAFIVRPTTPGQAYDSADTAFDTEALLVLSELDPVLNQSTDPTTFDMRDYLPTYWMINGKAYPQTDPISTSVGSNVLLRYVNAGLQNHSMALMGLGQTVVGIDGSPLTYPYRIVAESFAPGQTTDVIVSVPVSATQGSKYLIYNGSLLLSNAGAPSFGGMMTVLQAGAAVPPTTDVVGPATTAVMVTPSPTDGTANVALSATISDVDTGGSNVVAAEYFLGSPGADGTGVAMTSTGGFGGTSTDVQATISAATLGALSAGNYVVYVHGQDSANNWGPLNFAVLRIGKGGPEISGLGLMPNPTNGTMDVALTATGIVTPTGSGVITAAEYFVDAPGADGSGTTMAVNTPAPVASLDAVIPMTTVAGLAEGPHTLSVHAQDSLGIWGMYGTIDLLVDLTGPTTSGVAVAPNPTNGRQGVNSNIAALRVTADLADPLASGVQSNVVAGEGFIDTVGADGTGFVFVATDSVFDSLSEMGYADIPLSTVALLSDGTHTIYVHGKDAAGNWGATSSVDVLVDKGAPVISDVLVDPSPTLGLTNVVTLTALATDATSNVVAAEWFVGADPGLGMATPMAAADGTFDSLSEGLMASVDITGWDNGIYLLWVRAQDAVGNWSVPMSGELIVGQADQNHFSTFGNGAVPGVATPYDDSDVYAWDGGAFSRAFDATSGGLPFYAGVDALHWVDANHFYVSLTDNNTNIAGLGNVQDEDVLYYNNGVWSVFFDGTAQGLTSGSQDIDALSIVGGVMYFSTLGNGSIPGVSGPYDNSDIYAWDGTSFSRVWDATANGVPGGAWLDGLHVVDATHFYISFDDNANLPTLGVTPSQSIVYYDNGTWSVYFDGPGHSLTTNSQDLDAISIR